MKTFFWGILPWVGMILVGCGAPVTEDTVFDCILELPDVARGFDQFVVDLSNSEDLKYLQSGWHVPGTEGIPMTRFVWTAETEATVMLNAETVEEKELLLAVRPYHFEGAAPATLELAFNDESIGRIRLKDEWRTYRLLIPERLVEPGENTLFIRQSRLYRPSDVMVYSEDHRMLGASFAYFVFRQKQSPRPPDMYTLSQALGARNFIWGGKQRHVLYSPAPATFSWSIDLPSRPVLSFGAGYMPEGYTIDGADARFEVTVSAEGDTDTLFYAEMPPPRRLLEMGWDEYRRDLSAYARQTVTLTFQTPLSHPDDGTPNDGSWLEPMILNRHVARNLIFLPVQGPYPPTAPEPGSAMEKLRLRASVTDASFAPLPTGSRALNVPAALIETLRREGWPIGYFYTGRSPFSVEDAFGRQFEAVVGRDTTTDETTEEIVQEAFDWIQRLENRNFVLILDTLGAHKNPGLQEKCLETMAQWLLDHLFLQDSLILIYNIDGGSPCWAVGPESNPVDVTSMTQWDTLHSLIAAEFLELSK